MTTRPGLRTTEFAVVSLAATAVGLVATLEPVTGTADALVRGAACLGISLLGAAYTVSRALAKRGRE